MFKRNLLIVFLLFFLLGCSRCILIRSEFYKTTAIGLAQKAPEEVELFASKEELRQPYREIGIIKVQARYGTSTEAIDEEARKRAAAAGADAVVGMTYDEDKDNTEPFCGFFVSSKRNREASGIAIVFTDVETP